MWEWGTCLHLHVSGGGIPCKWKCYTEPISDYFIHFLEPYSTTMTCELSFHAFIVEWTYSVFSKSLVFILTILTTSDKSKRCTGLRLFSFGIYLDLIHKRFVLHRSDSNQDSGYIAILFFCFSLISSFIGNNLKYAFHGESIFVAN